MHNGPSNTLMVFDSICSKRTKTQLYVSNSLGST